MGLHGSDTAELALDDVEVDDDALLGEVGDGFKIAMSALDSGRYSRRRRLRRHLPGLRSTRRSPTPRSASSSAARSRRFQLVQAMIADMRVQTDAARMLVWRAGFLKDQGRPRTTETSIAKLLRDRGGAELREPRDPGPRRLGLRRRPPGRALLPRRARDDALRGHLADPEADHRPRGDRASTRSSADAPAVGDRRRRRRRDDGRRDRAARGAVAARGRCCTTRSPRRSSAASSGIAARPRARRRARALDADGRAAAAERARAGRRRSTTLAACELVIEAAPERLELKRELFARARRDRRAPTACSPPTPPRCRVTAIAAGVPRPRARRRHALLQPGAADGAASRSSPASSSGRGRARARARATGEAMGKHVIDAADGPGFLVNRCNRPFGLEALRLVQERLATLEQIDRICRLGGGFRMGPFELMDLVGIDVGFEVSKSFYEQSFGEPRWRPSPLAARMVAAGRTAARPAAAGTTTPTAARTARTPTPPEPRRRRRALVVIAGDGAARRRAARAPRTRPAGTWRARRGRGRGAVPDPRLRRTRGRAAAAGRPAGAPAATRGRWPRSTPAAARSASTRCRRSATRWSS